MKALVLFFMPFFFYFCVYICVNAIRPPDGSNMSAHLDNNLDLSGRIRGAGDYDANIHGQDLEFWQRVLTSALEDAADTTTQIGGLKPTKGTFLYVRELEVPYEVRLLLPLHAAAPAAMCCCRSLALPLLTHVRTCDLADGTDESAREAYWRTGLHQRDLWRATAHGCVYVVRH